MSQLQLATPNRLHTVLRTPDILRRIFKHCSDKRTVAASARVCSAWTSPALDVLWSEVGLETVMKLLCLMCMDPVENALNLTREVLPADWDRFERYAYRVRALSYANLGPLDISQKAFEELARTRRRLDILPNLHSLCWNGPPLLSTLFSHSRVDSFKICVYAYQDEQERKDLMKLLPSSLPNLVSLEVAGDVAHSMGPGAFDDELVSTLERLPKLKTLALPCAHTTGRILQTLEVVGRIQTIRNNDDCDALHFGDTELLQLTSFETALPTLSALSLHISVETAIALFSPGCIAPNLVDLEIHSCYLEAAHDIERLFELLAETCPRLTRICVASRRDASTATDVLTDKAKDDQRIGLETIRPLFQLTQLKQLEVFHHYPPHLRMEELEEITANFPELRTCILVNDPCRGFAEADRGWFKKLSLEALVPFARHCPKLEKLGLFLDSTAPCPSLDSAPVALGTARVFPQLRNLSLGMSDVDPANERTSVYLGQVLPLGCVVDSKLGWVRCGVPELVKEDVREMMFQKASAWGELASSVDEAIRARIGIAQAVV